MVNCFEPKRQFLLVTGGCRYQQQTWSSSWTQIYNIGLTQAPGVKSLLSTDPGVREMDDAKEAAQCLSTRRLQFCNRLSGTLS